MMGNDIPIPEIKNIVDVLQDNLFIPSYQRPYKWKADKHVRQLLEDIERESQKETKEYRIGTLILHKENDIRNVVDGQQRLVTISLILYVLGYTGEYSILKQHFTHSDTKNNIKFNYEYILNYFKILPEKRRLTFQLFLLNKCSFVVILLNDLSEAFQLFDSQNARGKTLEPEDLLKAFHLREMAENTSIEKKYCVGKWEKAIDEGILNTVIGKYLFRIRNWKRKDWEYYFTKDEIEEFKGLSIIQSIKEGKMYPYISVAMQNSFSTNYQINEPIVNGKRFFSYVDYYVQMFKELKEFQENTKRHDLVFYYGGCYRIGDKRIRNLFQNILMCYYDKFGCDDSFNDFAKELYRWAYTTRLTQTQIRYQTIINLLKSSGINPIQIIESWYYPNILAFRRQIKLLEKVNIVKINYEISECINSIELTWKN